jgi:hypothetical protein
LAAIWVRRAAIRLVLPVPERWAETNKTPKETSWI